MKKEKEDIKKIEISCVKIYKNDLEEIINIFKKEDFIKSIEIKACGFKLEFEEIDELEKKIGINKINKLEIIAYIPDEHCNIEINFNRHGVYIYSYKLEDTKIFGVVKKVEDFLITKRRIFSELKNEKLYLIVVQTSFIFIIVFFYHLIFDFFSKKNLLIFTFFFFFVFIFYAFLTCIREKYKNLIYLKNQNELPNFFIRKKDDIILSVVSAIIGIIITAIITLFIK